jgi:hypothetical protein
MDPRNPQQFAMDLVHAICESLTPEGYHDKLKVPEEPSTRPTPLQAQHQTPRK